MRNIIFIALGILSVVFMQSRAQEKIILVNEGEWQTDNGRITYFEDGRILSNQWFKDNNGYKLGDTPTDILQINDNLVAIALNWSNIIQFITPDGKAVGVTEDIPNNRKLVSDGHYLYVTSYAHEVTVGSHVQKFTKGYVAKIDINTFKVVDAVEVGYEPEGIALYRGKLFVANSGGYAFQEGHDYETTVSVVDANTMKVTRTIDTGQINLYYKISQSGRYLCINSPGDYYVADAATILIDCQAALEGKADSECVRKLAYASTANCVDSKGNFYAVGSRFSYYTNKYEYDYVVINPEKVFESDGSEGVTDLFPGTVKSDLQSMAQPYSIFVNPYTDYIYATDSGEYVSAGYLYQWSPQGVLLGKFKTYINPAHFLALPPNGEFNGIYPVERAFEPDEDAIYNLQGIPVKHLVPGQIYISQGRKFLR